MARAIYLGWPWQKVIKDRDKGQDLKQLRPVSMLSVGQTAIKANKESLW